MNDKMKKARLEKNLSQTELAKIIGVSRQTIIAIENNKYNPTLELAMRLARYLHTTVEELFVLEEEAR